MCRQKLGRHSGLERIQEKKSYQTSVKGVEAIWTYYFENVKAENQNMGSFCKNVLFWLENTLKIDFKGCDSQKIFFNPTINFLAKNAKMQFDYSLTQK